MVKKIVDLYGWDGNMLHLRFVVTCLLCFSGFLRIGELLELMTRDIHFYEECVRITIPKSKTDQLREGHIVHIARTYTKYCPVATLKRYLDYANLDQKKSEHVICRLVKTRTGHKAKGNIPISYSCIRGNFKKLVQPIC